MKKWKASFFLAFFLLAACATVPRTPLNPGDLSILKGTWEGSRDILWGKYRSYDATVLEIYNDQAPLRGTVRIAFMEGKYPVRYSFENGGTDSQGNLSIPLREDIRINLTLYREGNKMKLDGKYLHGGNEGTLTLYKR